MAINREDLASLSPVKLAVLANEAREAAQIAMHEPIAVIGMACRYPGGAANIEEFWKLLSSGRDGIIDMPSDRFDVGLYYDEKKDAPGKMYVKRFGLLQQNIKAFDAEFFGISPREAWQLDPQQRLLLECTWEALEDACIAPSKLKGSNTGVFVGLLTPDYYSMIFSGLEGLNAYSATGTSFSVGCGRISYILGLMGPSITYETACSSSLVALHGAVQALRMDECNLAVVGGVNAIVSPSMTIACCKASMLSADGRCKTFDASADGYVRGEGVGILVLKRLSDAIISGDPIHALIRGSAVNHCGRGPGLTAPNSLAQESCIKQALKSGGIQPDQVDFVESHGTGTSLGDPIEIQALGNVYGASRNGNEKYIIGAVKTNIGHLESGAGVAGVIKAILCLKKQEIPKHLNFSKLNPYIDLEAAKARIPLENISWPSGSKRRFAGVSSFGFGGTNAHAILEEAPTLPSRSAKISSENHIVTVSARSEISLKRLIESYLKTLQQESGLNCRDIAYVSSACRAHFSHRLAVVADSTEKLRALLTKALAGEADPRIFKDVSGAEKPAVCFLFSGQGSQYSGMGKDLFEAEPLFKSTLEQCEKILKPFGIDLFPLLFDAGKQTELNSTINTQPVLFAFEYALAQLWMSWGLKPSVVVGHSLGEYVAACIAGVFSVEDGLRFVVERAKLMNSLPANATGMSALMCTADRAKEILETNKIDLEFASLNARDQVVLSGPLKELQKLTELCTKFDIVCRPLPVSHGFHSRAMDPILEKFESLAASIHFNKPQIDVVSNLTGKAMETVPNSSYWRNHLKSPVLFEQGAHYLNEKGYRYYLEIGPHATLTNLIKQAATDQERTRPLPTMRRNIPSSQLITEALMSLYAGGVDINWGAFYSGKEGQKITLPTYVFDHDKTYWYDGQN